MGVEVGLSEGEVREKLEVCYGLIPITLCLETTNKRDGWYHDVRALY